jgi:trehalose 6-phosphate synthase/phosphatase
MAGIFFLSKEIGETKSERADSGLTQQPINGKFKPQMGKLILVSNRLAVSVRKKDGRIDFSPSMGGLATGLSSLCREDQTLWIGWCGVPTDQLDGPEIAQIDETLKKKYNSMPVYLSSAQLKTFYYGFCNDVIWPLFHYFPSYTVYDNSLWEAYESVNALYLQKVLERVEPGDTIWIHDYQLMLLPGMIRQKLPDAHIGFFLHIPFPSFEIFRLLPWREQVLQGLLGADLIGFHGFDYARHFISSVRRLMGVENNMAYVTYDHHISRVDVFPMGIDYEKYSTALSLKTVQQEMKSARDKLGTAKVILSVDRLDYTKGIPQRLKAYDRFLELNPQYRENVVLFLIVVPSRTKVPHYRHLKKEVDELASAINGKYGTIAWAPIHYFYRGFPYEELAAFYGLADVLLVTPLRDGMNLVAKEFVASHKDRTGTLILSETAGSAREMGEALLINPNNVEAIAEALKAALELPEQEQQENNAAMNERLRRYDIHAWIRDFLDKLDQVRQLQEKYLVKKISDQGLAAIRKEYQEAARRLFLLDYDGTLVPLVDRPARAAPDPELCALLRKLASDPANVVAVGSGRNRWEMASWLEELGVHLIAGHGAWIKPRGEQWRLSEPLSDAWKEQLLPIFELFKDRTPGSRIEEKEHSLAWHFRSAEPELAALRVSELKDILFSMIGDLNLEVLDGNKALEVKDVSINKGKAAFLWLSQGPWDFILAAGDDATDEDLFSLLPENAYSVKVGMDVSTARFYVESHRRLRQLLEEVIH